MKNIILDHLNLTVSDFEQTVSWYHRVFGFELVEKGLDENKSPWGVLRNGNHMLCIYEEKGRIALSENNPEHEKLYRIFHFGLRVRDRKEWESIIDKEKLKLFYEGEVRYPHSTSWYVMDPSGYEIEVSYWNNDEVTF